MSRAFWTIRQYAIAAGMPKATARDWLKREHARSCRDGKGGWFFQDAEGVYRINMPMLRACRPELEPIQSLPEVVAGIDVRLTRVEAKVERMGSSMRAMGGRLSSLPPPMG